MFPDFVIGGTLYASWDVCFDTAIFLTLFLVVLLKPKDFPINRLLIFIGGLIFVFFALLGIKLGDILLHWQDYKGLSFEQIIDYSAHVYLGAPLLGFLSIWVLCLIGRVSFLELADYIAPILMLTQTIGRLGCLLNGCCYGMESNLPWAVSFANGPLRHPTQAYAIVSAFSIFITGIFYYRRIRKFRGLSFCFVFSTYSFVRFFNEFLRVDSLYIIGPFKVSNITFLTISLIFALCIFILMRRKDALQRQEIATRLKAMFRLFLICFAISGIIALIVLSLLR